MTIPDRCILEECFREGYPYAIVQAIEHVGVARGRFLAAQALSEAWLIKHRGVDTYGVAAFIRAQAMKQACNP